MNLLLNSTQDLQAVLPLASDLTFAQLRGYVLDAQAFVERYVGRPLMLMVTQSPASHAELAELMRVPIAHFALHNYVRLRVAKIADVGVLRVSSANEKDAFEWQHDEVKNALIEQAWQGLENLLRYIETNLADFPEYAQSALYQADQTYLIRSAEVFDRYYAINASRMTFTTLLPCLRTAEERRVRPLLGARHAELLGTNLTDAQRELLNVSRRALVYATLARALRERQVDLTPQGIQVRGISPFSAIRYEQPADDKRLGASIDHFEQEAQDALSEIGPLLRPDQPLGASSRLAGTKIVFF